MARGTKRSCKRVKLPWTRYVWPTLERSAPQSRGSTADVQAKARFDSTAEELERVLVAKEGESLKESGMRSSASTSGGLSSAGLSGSGASSSGGSSGVNGRKAFNKAIKSGGMLFKGKGPASMAKHEDDTRARMAQASETFRKAVLESQTLRQEYFNFQLPKILRVRLSFCCFDREDYNGSEDWQIG